MNAVPPTNPLIEPSAFDVLRVRLASAPADGTIELSQDEAAALLDAAPAVELSIDPNYAAREGFNENFLGIAVPLPRLDAELLGDVTTFQGPDGAEESVLRYHHYSVVMSRSRRFAFVTAVNIDGRRRFTIDRTADKWAFDPRLAKEDQVGSDLYARNDLDRGHLVRRQDPDWGDSLEEAQTANDDTFHFTNCTPQHKNFNQNSQTWHGLEDYILTNVSREKLRACVFNAPLFTPDDLTYRGVQIPGRFWKIVVAITGEGKLHATAYLLTQEDLIGSLELGFEFGQYKTFQVPITTIESLARMNFGTLREADPLAADVQADFAPSLELRMLSDVRLV